MQVELAEHATTPVPLSRAQRAQLQRVVEGKVSIAPSLDHEGVYDVDPGSWIGGVHLDDGLELVLRPKLPIDRVLFLLSYAADPKHWREESVRLVEAPSLLEAILPGFTYQLHRALECGLLQGYRGQDEALPTVRGRWRIGDQVRNRFGIAPPVEVSFDDFTVDIQLHRILRAAVHRLLHLPLRNDRLRWPLRAIDQTLADVQLVEFDRRRLPEVRFDRRSEHYRAAVELSRRVLADVSFDLAAGAVGASAFLVDMNGLFEDFVVVALGEALGPEAGELVRGARGRNLFLDRARRVRLEPDLSLWASGRCVFVGDVKYKRLADRETAPNADLYQLAAYTLATGLPSGVLIYAQSDEPDSAHELVHNGARLEIVSLDLTQPPERVLERIAEIAARIRRQALAA